MLRFDVYHSLGDEPDINGNDAFRTPMKKKKHELKVTYFRIKMYIEIFGIKMYIDIFGT
jgi:hypothetical protein